MSLHLPVAEPASPRGPRANSRRPADPDSPRETIHYVLQDSRFGRFLMAASDKGVCLIEFGRTDEVLLAGLAQTFPDARLVPALLNDPPLLTLHSLRFAQYLDGQGGRPTFTLDLRGTPLQLLVWRHLQQLEPWQRLTYGELAQAIGRPRAYRAVASACAANRIAVLVACHQVGPASGEAGQYRWGPALKHGLREFLR